MKCILKIPCRNVLHQMNVHLMYCEMVIECDWIFTKYLL